MGLSCAKRFLLRGADEIRPRDMMDGFDLTDTLRIPAFTVLELELTEAPGLRSGRDLIPRTEDAGMPDWDCFGLPDLFAEGLHTSADFTCFCNRRHRVGS